MSQKIKIPKAAPQKENKKKKAFKTFHFWDNNWIIFILVTVSFLLFCFKINLNFKPEYPKWVQLKYLNPDAKLYYNIAENMVSGIGFQDTIRNMVILPSVGHPGLLALCCVIGELDPYKFTYLFFLLSAILLVLSIKIFTKSNLFSLSALLIYSAFFADFRWLSANVESSIVFSNALLVLTFAVFYKFDFKIRYAIIAGVALAFNILIRPLYLFPVHLCLIIFLVIFLFYFLGKHKKIPVFVSGWFCTLLIADMIIFATGGYSYLKYKDSRLVTGTYGVYPLYAANNIYVPIDKPYDTRWNLPEYYKKQLTLIPDVPGMTWQKRHQILMDECFNYIKQNPGRAAQAYWWRFRHFIGFGQSCFWQKQVNIVHGISCVSMVLLVIAMLTISLIKRQFKKVLFSFGMLMAGLLVLFAVIHSWFTYAEFRYVMVSIPFIVAADCCLVFELINLLPGKMGLSNDTAK